MNENTSETANVENQALRRALNTPEFVEETKRSAAHLLSREVDTTEIKDVEGGE